MEKRATDTAEFLKFFDSVFDSVNGCGIFDAGGKILKTSVDVVSEETIHTRFWKEAIDRISTMHTVDVNGRTKVPPTFKNWSFTLKNYLQLRNKLKSLGFKKFCPRFINQDPFENFFGRIRQ